MKKLTYREALDIKDKLHEAARADDPKFSNVVYLRHNDGTSLTYFGAYLVLLSDEFSVVVTEHHGSRVVCVEDYDVVVELEQTPSLGLKKTLIRCESLKKAYDKKMEKLKQDKSSSGK